MLSELSVRNVVLIDQLTVHFGGGLNVLSGETGAGKTILLAALGLALGYRAEVRLLRQGCEDGEVSAVFTFSDGEAFTSIMHLLDTHGLRGDFAASGEIILRRLLNVSGKSRAYVNDRPVSVSVLRILAGYLMEVQGHFEQQGLLDSNNHREFLDNYGGLTFSVRDYAKLYAAYREVEKDYLAVVESQDKRQDEYAYLQAMIAELESLAVEDAEEARLDNQRRRLRNAESLIHVANALDWDMRNDDGLQMRLQAHVKALQNPEFAADELVQKALQSLTLSLSEFWDAAAHLQAAQAQLSDGEESLEQVEERLFGLRACARKHQCTVAELPARLVFLQKQSEALRNPEQLIAERQAVMQEHYQACLDKAQQISSQRHIAAKALDKAVAKLLPPLKLQNIRFATEIISATDTGEQALRSEGMDKVTFMVQSNSDMPASAVGKIASAGELSRLLLALRSALADRREDKMHAKTLVFDEVDSGIGGATAHAVGQKLKRLAEHRQIILITHSAQVAAFAHQHFFVGKSRDHTSTRIRQLSNQDRVGEIARMLSGASITSAARSQAQELITSATGYI